MATPDQPPQAHYKQEPMTAQYQPQDQQPNHNHQQHQVHPSNGWQAGLFDCTPMDSCLLGTFCTCFLVGQTASRLQDPSNPSPDCCNSTCMIWYLLAACTGCGQGIFQMSKRTEIREKYGIQGSGFGDFCISCCCTCCAAIQQDNEVKKRQQGMMVVNQGYSSQPGMHV